MSINKHKATQKSIDCKCNIDVILVSPYRNKNESNLQSIEQ